jgi:hypothetical protein
MISNRWINRRRTDGSMAPGGRTMPDEGIGEWRMKLYKEKWQKKMKDEIRDDGQKPEA